MVREAKDFIVNLASSEKNARLKASTGLYHPFVTRQTTEAFDDGFIQNYFAKYRESLALDEKVDRIMKTSFQAMM